MDKITENSIQRVLSDNKKISKSDKKLCGGVLLQGLLKSNNPYSNN